MTERIRNRIEELEKRSQERQPWRTVTIAEIMNGSANPDIQMVAITPEEKDNDD